jgi:uncharacterized protein HemY
MRRFLVLFVLLPLAVIVVALSVANRELVTLSLDPFGSPAPRWSLTLPLVVVLYATLGLGVLLGGVATWLKQGKWRQAARAERANAARLRQEVERLRERIAASLPALPSQSDRDAA